MTQPQTRVSNQDEVIKALLETNRQLTEQIITLSKIVAGIQNPTINIPMQASNDPMFMPESEEDANFLLRTGQIDKKEFEDILQELKFYNSEITIPTA